MRCNTRTYQGVTDAAEEQACQFMERYDRWRKDLIQWQFGNFCQVWSAGFSRFRSPISLETGQRSKVTSASLVNGRVLGQILSFRPSKLHFFCFRVVFVFFLISFSFSFWIPLLGFCYLNVCYDGKQQFWWTSPRMIAPVRILHFYSYIPTCGRNAVTFTSCMRV